MSDTPKLQQAADGGCPPATCSLSSLHEAARKYRKEHFLRSTADPTDQDARDGYYYEEGRSRAYAEGMNELKLVALQRDSLWAYLWRNFPKVAECCMEAPAVKKPIIIPENAKSEP